MIVKYFVQTLWVNANSSVSDDQFLIAALTDGNDVIPIINKGDKTLLQLKDSLNSLVVDSEHSFIFYTTEPELLNAVQLPDNMKFIGSQLTGRQYDYVYAVLRDIAADIQISHPFSPAYDNRRNCEELFGSRKVHIYTDASSTPHTNVIGWVRKSFPLLEFSFEEKLFGSVNDLEFLAVCSAISAYRNASSLVIHSDSMYSVREFKRLQKLGSVAEVLSSLMQANPLVEEGHAVAKTIVSGRVEVLWVKGHQDDDWNVCADQMVRYARRRIKVTNEKAVRKEVAKLLANLLNNRSVVI